MNCSGLIVSTPVYFGGITGQMKTLLDRTLLLSRIGRRMANKVGGVICVGKRGGHEFAGLSTMNVMNLQGMILPGNASVHVFADEPGSVRGNRDSLARAEDLGRRIAELCASLSPE